MKFQFNDGGRKEAGYKGSVGDCVTRALVIANDLDYKTTYRRLSQEMLLVGRDKTARNGIAPSVTTKALMDLGWKKVAIQGKKRFRADNLPKRKKVIVRLHRHLCVVIDGVIQDTWDSSKNGDALIQEIWVKK